LWKKSKTGPAVPGSLPAVHDLFEFFDDLEEVARDRLHEDAAHVLDAVECVAREVHRERDGRVAREDGRVAPESREQLFLLKALAERAVARADALVDEHQDEQNKNQANAHIRASAYRMKGRAAALPFSLCGMVPKIASRRGGRGACRLLLVYAVDREHDRERRDLALVVVNVELVAVAPGQPLLADRRDHAAVLNDGVVVPEKVAVDLPAQALDVVARAEEREPLDDLGDLLAVHIDEKARQERKDLLLDEGGLPALRVVDVQALAPAEQLALDVVFLILVLVPDLEPVAPGKNLLLHVKTHGASSLFSRENSGDRRVGRDDERLFARGQRALRHVQRAHEFVEIGLLLRVVDGAQDAHILGLALGLELLRLGFGLGN